MCFQTQKKYNLEDPSDMGQVLDIVEDTDLDFCDSDDANDDIWLPNNHTFEESDDGASDALNLIIDIKPNYQNSPDLTESRLEITASTSSTVQPTRSYSYSCKNLVKVDTPVTSGNYEVVG